MNPYDLERKSAAILREREIQAFAAQLILRRPVGIEEAFGAAEKFLAHCDKRMAKLT